MLVDILLEPLVGDVHLAKPCENLVGAGIVVLGDVCLKLCGKSLRFGGSGGGVSDMGYVKEVIEAIKEINPNIMVEQAAGITNGQQVYDFIMAGSDAAGAASGIIKAKDPLAMIDEMIAATRRAADDLKKLNK